MKLKLVKATNKYRNQIVDMLDEWNNSGEEIIPYVIGRLDYSDFDYYCNNLEVRDTSELIKGTISSLITAQGTLSSWWVRIVLSALLCFFIVIQSVLASAKKKK